jgi:AcrR family transcriptional regulator
MPATAKTARKYDASRRQAQAKANRSRILAAARELFLECGYAGATLASIAERADVALPTVYAAFGGKRGLLAELLETSTGDSALPVQALGRNGLASIEAVDDPVDKLRECVGAVYRSLDETCDLLLALRAASGVEAEAAELERRVQEQRFEELRAVAAHLGSRGLLRSGLSVGAAAETLWALADVQLFKLLVRDRGWRPARYKKWLLGLFVSSLHEAAA